MRVGGGGGGGGKWGCDQVNKFAVNAEEWYVLPEVNIWHIHCCRQ